MDKEQKVTKNRRKRITQLKRIIVSAAFVMLTLPSVLSVIGLMKISQLNQELSQTQAIVGQLATEISQMQPDCNTTTQTTSAPIIISQDSVMSGTQTQQTQQIDPYEGMIKVCLTFDDGPSSNTDAILDILDSYGVKGTFFVNGKDGYEEQYRRIVSEGHTLGMHSYSHDYSDIYQDLDSFAEDLYQIQTFLKEITGVECTFYRFPGGSSNTVSDVDMLRCIQYLEAKGISYYDWNVSSGDAVNGYMSVNSIVTNVMAQIETVPSDVIVILFHDSADKDTTVEALPIIIENILAMDNVVIVPVTDELTPVRHIEIESETIEN